MLNSQVVRGERPRRRRVLVGTGPRLRGSRPYPPGHQPTGAPNKLKEIQAFLPPTGSAARRKTAASESTTKSASAPSA